MGSALEDLHAVPPVWLAPFDGRVLVSMKIESPSFGPTEILGFVDELVLFERDRLVERLEAASAELGELAARVPARGEGGTDWSAHEVMAHIAALSKLYGMMVYKVGSGEMPTFDLLAMIGLRDPTAQALLGTSPTDLAAMARGDHERTAAYLRRGSVEGLQRRVALGPLGTMTAGEIARLPLVSHVEQHVRQLRSALG